MAQTQAQPGTADVSVGYATCQGKVRETNQDNVGVIRIANAPLGECVLAVVADGMGGHHGGEIASGICVDSILESVQSASQSIDSWDAGRTVLREALHVAHSQIRQYATTKKSNLGTTATAALYCGGEAEIAHVGDSRAYLVSNDELRQLTEDDSWVAEQVRRGAMSPAEAESSANRNVLTQALSASPEVSVHSYHERVPQRTCLLLCSDGLHSVVKAPALKHIVGRASGPKVAAEELVNSANALGGPDNITVVCLYTEGGPRAKSPTVPVRIGRFALRSPIRRAIAAMVAVAVTLGLALFGWSYLRRSGEMLPSDDNGVHCTLRLEGQTARIECDRNVKCEVYFKIAPSGAKYLRAARSELPGGRVAYSANTKRSIIAVKPVTFSVDLDTSVGHRRTDNCVLETTRWDNAYQSTIDEIVGAPNAKIVLTWTKESSNRAGAGEGAATATLDPSENCVAARTDSDERVGTRHDSPEPRSGDARASTRRSPAVAAAEENLNAASAALREAEATLDAAEMEMTDAKRKAEKAEERLNSVREQDGVSSANKSERIKAAQHDLDRWNSARQQAEVKWQQASDAAKQAKADYKEAERAFYEAKGGKPR